MSDAPALPDLPDCAAFEDRSAELALGIVEPPERDLLVAHAASCRRCGPELESMAGIADRLSALAPSAEPPVGFEVRAVEAMVGASTGAAPPRRRTRWLVAAALVLLAGVVGAALARSNHADDTRLAALDRVGVSSARSGVLVDGAGNGHGSVLLTDGTRTQLTMTLAGLDEGVYRCSIRHADGTVTEVASWPIDQGGSGTWTVPVTGALLDAVRTAPESLTVVISEADGTAVSTAQLR